MFKFNRSLLLMCMLSTTIYANENFDNDLSFEQSKPSINLNENLGGKKTHLSDLIRDNSSQVQSSINNIRYEMLMNAGTAIGFQHGIKSKAKDFFDALDKREKQLSGIYQFSTLVQQNGVLPPVIVEAQNLTSYSNDQLRTALKVYKIVKPEKFVSVPPTWKDYLLEGLLSPPNEYAGIKPENSAEVKVWNGALRKGWKQGEEQAENILLTNFSKLNRDYMGMMLYSSLRQQGMVTSTKTGESIVSVTTNTNEVLIGDKHKRILDTAKFTPQENWHPILNRDSSLDEGKVTDSNLLKNEK